jgi:outer membrane protein TolC
MSTVVFIALLLVTCGRDSSAQDRDISLSLGRCLQRGLESSEAAIAARLSEEEAGYQRREALGRLLPSVEAFGSYDNYLKVPVQMVPGEIFGRPGTTIPVSLSVRHNVSAGFRAAQVLYDGGAWAALASAGASRVLTALRGGQVRADLLFEVAGRYLQLAAAEGQAELYDAIVARLDTVLRIAEARCREGYALPTDAERARVDRDNLATARDQLRLLVSRQRDALLAAIGCGGELPCDAGERLVLTDSLQRPLMDSAAEPAAGDDASGSAADSLVLLRPEALVLDGAVELAASRRHAAASAFLPVLSISGQWFWQGQRDRFDFLSTGERTWFGVGVVALNLSLPLFDGLQRSARLEQADVDCRQSAVRRDFAHRALRMEYTAAADRRRVCAATVERQQRNAANAARVRDVMLARYREGMAPLTDLLSVESGLSAAQLALIDARRDLRLAELDCLKAAGLLPTLLHHSD